MARDFVTELPSKAHAPLDHGPSGGYPSRGPSLLRRLTLCKLSLCETFKTASDEAGIWGECQKCGKRVGYIDRAALRDAGRSEHEAEMRRRATRC